MVLELYIMSLWTITSTSVHLVYWTLDQAVRVKALPGLLHSVLRQCMFNNKPLSKYV